MGPRILIASASVGSGHGRAAEAVQLALQHLRPEARVHHVDVLQLTNAAFRGIYDRGYFGAVARMPHLVSYVYDRLDRQPGAGRFSAERLRLAMERLHFGRFIELVTAEPWDLIVHTHFLPPAIVAWLRTTGRTEVPQVTVTTDFDVHRLWANAPTEHYFTATAEGRANLAGWGVPAPMIAAVGIPIHPAFGQPKCPTRCRTKHGIGGGGRPVVLQLCGGGGFGPVAAAHRAILDVPMPIQLVTVAGRNDALRTQLESTPCPARHRRAVLGFTRDIDELMAAADVIVSKPGGLTTSEALARGAAMVVIDPIPGQEDRNCDFLLENGVAMKVNNLASLAHKLTALLDDPARLGAMRGRAAELARPHAAIDVAEAALTLIGSSPAPRSWSHRPPVAGGRARSGAPVLAGA